MIRGVFLLLLLLLANSAYGRAGYQRTKDGKTLVWNSGYKSGEEATWSGKRDAKGYATGRGTLTWYRAERSLVTGSNIPSGNARTVVASRFSGKMAEGKLEGMVVVVDTRGRTFHAKFAGGEREGEWTPGPGPTATPGPRVREEVEREAIVKGPAPSATPAVIEPAQETAVESAAIETLTRPNDSLRSLTRPPSTLREAAAAEASPEPSLAPIPTAAPTFTATPTPRATVAATAAPRAIATAMPRAMATASPTATATPSSTPTPAATVSPVATATTDDAKIVAALDTQYQAAVKANDAVTMDRILADDFVLVTGRGRASTKADLMKAAREKRAIYEHQEEQEGTQRVRVWGETAVVTALLSIKGMEEGKPLDYQLWFSDTYIRTPAGWRYAFGQASLPLPKVDAK